MIVGISGHRNERLNKSFNFGEVQKWLIQELTELKNKYGDDLFVVTGMAEGVDQIAAITALNLDIKVICWFAYKHPLCLIEESIVERAYETRFMYSEKVTPAFYMRDRAIVDESDLMLIVWDRQLGGGTWLTYEYAKEKGKKIKLYEDFR